MCFSCDTVEKKYKNESLDPNIFIVHAERSDITASGKQVTDDIKKKKKHLIQKIEKRVSALRNTDGGVLLVHLNGQRTGDRYLEYFHEFIDKTLQKLIECGRLYVKTYICRWLCELPGFEQFHEFVIINVSQTLGISTVDFNTKISNDFEKECPQTIHIVSLLSQRIYERQCRPKIRGITDPKLLHENREVELKAYRPSNEVLRTIETNITNFVNYIWINLKLKDSLTSMSKNPNGGSYYVGIAETTVNENYKTKSLDVDGLTLKVDKEDLKKALYQKVADETSVLNLNGTFGDAPEDLMEICFHDIPRDKQVIEIAIRYFSGVVFYDKEGPRTYIVERGVIHRMDRREWFRRIHRRLPAWKTHTLH